MQEMHLDNPVDGTSAVVKAYHIFYDLESQFLTMDDVKRFMEETKYLSPRLPLTADKNEDVIPRVCAASTVKGCISGIIPDMRFRRCIADGPGDYKNKDECYPIIIATLEGEFFSPTPEQCHDVELTGELWATHDVCVKSMSLVWLQSDSIVISYPKGAEHYICKDISWSENPTGHHPWVDGMGHPLECSDTGDIWPPDEMLYQALWFETYFGNTVVSIVPEFPATGFCQCFPIDGSPPYRGRLQNCRKFSGKFDNDGFPLFEWDLLRCRRGVGFLQQSNGKWGINLFGLFTDLDSLGEYHCLESNRKHLHLRRMPR